MDFVKMDSDLSFFFMASFPSSKEEEQGLLS
jgi:hypothetical protein